MNIAVYYYLSEFINYVYLCYACQIFRHNAKGFIDYNFMQWKGAILIEIRYYGKYSSKISSERYACINQEGAVVVITGASSGLGKELALLLCKRKIRLILTGRDA
jgi:hypothetical protein